MKKAARRSGQEGTDLTQDGDEVLGRVPWLCLYYHQQCVCQEDSRAGTNACEDLRQHPLHPPHTLSGFLGGSMATHKMA